MVSSATSATGEGCVDEVLARRSGGGGVKSAASLPLSRSDASSSTSRAGDSSGGEVVGRRSGVDVGDAHAPALGRGGGEGDADSGRTGGGSILRDPTELNGRFRYDIAEEITPSPPPPAAAAAAAGGFPFFEADGAAAVGGDTLLRANGGGSTLYAAPGFAVLRCVKMAAAATAAPPPR